MSPPERPFFIVGCPRSGTTLLRLMLDAHPRLAVPRESHWVVGLPRSRFGRLSRPRTLDEALADQRVRRWDVDPNVLREETRGARPSTYPELVSAVFSAYAAAHGKARWGDKTPPYVTFLPQLDRWFPDAQFVHIIRDGRQVATSLIEHRWGPRTAVKGGFWWRRMVTAGRRDGSRLTGDRYLELRLEDLVADPDGALRRVCAFLGEDYAAEMLDYGTRPATRAVAAEQGSHHVVKPPTEGLRDWRAGRGPLERRAIEEACSPHLLAALGYRVGERSLSGRVYAWWVRGLDVPAETLRRVQGTPPSPLRAPSAQLGRAHSRR
jgi:hypothetical protein